MTGTGSLLRSHLATDRAAGAAVVVLVLAAAFLAAAVPRATDQLGTEGLRDAVDQAAPLDKDLRAVVGGQVPLDYTSEEDPTGPLRRMLQNVDDRLGPALAGRAAPGLASIRYRGLPVLAVTPRLPDEYDTGYLAATVLTDQADVPHEPGLGSRVRWVDGTAPGPGRRTLDPQSPPDPEDRFRPPPSGEQTGEALLEVGVSVDTASVYGLAPGSVVESGYRLSLRVSGVFEPAAAGDPYWQADASLLRPTESYSSREGRVQSGAVVVPHESAALLAAQLYLNQLATTSLRFPVSARGVEAANGAGLVLQVRRLEAERFAVPTPVQGPEPSFFDPASLGSRVTSSLDDVVLDQLRRQRTSGSVVALLSAGLFGVVLAVLTLATRLVVERRRGALALVVARGGSARQVALVQALEGLVLGLPAAVVGTAVGHVLVAGRPGVWGWLLPALLAAAPLVLLPVLGVLVMRDGAGGFRGGRRDAVVSVQGAAGRRRLVLDVLVVGVAVAAVLVLRRRGLDAADLPTGSEALDPATLLTSADPMLVAAPLLVALAAAALVARFAPAPLRRLAERASRRTGAVTFLGAARAGRDQVAGTLPVLVVLLAMATCVTGVMISGTASSGLQTAAAQQVGADARTSSTAFTPDALRAARAVEGVTDVAAVSEGDAAVASDVRDAAAELFATDVAVLSRVQADVPGAADLGALVASSSRGVDLERARVPVMTSYEIGAVGTEIEVSVGNDVVEAVVVATAPRLIPISGNRDWVLVDAGVLATTDIELPLPRVALVDLASPGAAGEDEVAGALDTKTPVTTRAEAVRQITEQPLVEGTLGSFGYLAALAAVLSALALVLMLVATGAERTRLLSRLRTLGLDARQSGSLVAWEALPVVLPGVLVGLLVGVVVSVAVYPAIDLRAFTGGVERPALAVDPLLLASSVTGVLVASGLAVAVAVRTGSRAQLGSVLRVGDET